MKHADVRAARGAQAIVMQAHRYVRTDGDARLYREKIRRKNLRLDVAPGEDNVARFIEITSEDLDFECFCLAGAEGENRDDLRAEVRKVGVGESTHGKQHKRPNRYANGSHRGTIFLAASELRLAVFYRKTNGLASNIVFGPVRSRHR